MLPGSRKLGEPWKHILDPSEIGLRADLLGISRQIPCLEDLSLNRPGKSRHPVIVPTNEYHMLVVARVECGEDRTIIAVRPVHSGGMLERIPVLPLNRANIPHPKVRERFENVVLERLCAGLP